MLYVIMHIPLNVFITMNGNINLNVTMMRQQPGVRSQPKLLTRNKPEMACEQQSREQLKMP
jgi:hypothetical protein